MQYHYFQNYNNNLLHWCV